MKESANTGHHNLFFTSMVDRTRSTDQENSEKYVNCADSEVLQQAPGEGYHGKLLTKNVQPILSCYTGID